MEIIKPTPISVPTLLLVAFTVFVIYLHFKDRFDSNIPIIYYIFLVAWWVSGGEINPSYALYVALGCALLLRFEFMNRAMARIFKYAELVVLVFIGWQMLGTLIAL